VRHVIEIEIDRLPKVLEIKGNFLGLVRAAGAGGSLWFRRMSDHSCVILPLWINLVREGWDVIGSLFIILGPPWQNCYSECFNARLCFEFAIA